MAALFAGRPIVENVETALPFQMAASDVESIDVQLSDLCSARRIVVRPMEIVRVPGVCSGWRTLWEHDEPLHGMIPVGRH